MLETSPNLELGHAWVCPIEAIMVIHQGCTFGLGDGCTVWLWKANTSFLVCITHCEAKGVFCLIFCTERTLGKYLISSARSCKHWTPRSIVSGSFPMFAKLLEGTLVHTPLSSTIGLYFASLSVSFHLSHLMFLHHRSSTYQACLLFNFCIMPLKTKTKTKKLISCLLKVWIKVWIFKRLEYNLPLFPTELLSCRLFLIVTMFQEKNATNKFTFHSNVFLPHLSHGNVSTSITI